MSSKGICSCGNELDIQWNEKEEFKVIICPNCNKELKFKNPMIKNNENAQDTSEVARDMARRMNYRSHAKILSVPVLTGFKVEDDGNPQTILIAADHGFVEQLTSDGFIAEGEFEKRIEIVINNNKRFLKNNGCENAEDSFIFYKDYNNGIFDFKIYVCDMIIGSGTERRVIRQFNAYFVENQMNDFYQLSLTVGPFSMPTETLKIGTIDLENDQITKNLDSMMKVLMDNLKYRNQ